MLLGVSACSSLPFGGGGPDPAEVTGSIPSPAPAGRDAPGGDWDVVAGRVTRVEPSEKLAIAWTNPATGHSGTVTRTAESRGPTGAPCRDFSTTVAKVGGVELYEGRLCKGASGAWELVAIAPTADKIASGTPTDLPAARPAH